MTDADPESSSFELLHPQIQRWIWRKGWNELRDIQEDAIQAVLRSGDDVIIAAATAGGKTEAAFLPLTSVLMHRATDGGTPRSSGPAETRGRSIAPSVSILYISPLKALINDQWQRLDDLCEDLQIPVHRWHGDVSSSMKRKLLERPSGILLITPESLEALFINHGPRLRSIFPELTAVVVDELHAFIGTERGMQLQSQIHRLEMLLRKRVRRIGLSATLGDMSLAAEFLRPGGREDVRLVRSEAGAQEVRLQIRGYLRSKSDSDEEAEDTEAIPEKVKAGGISSEHSIARHLFETLRGTNNLVFANSRVGVETFSDSLRRMCLVKRLPQEFWPHHGSLSKDLRTDVEALIKGGSRPITIVCTSTLELGIDIGTVRSVAQVGCPPGVASMRQRLGRSGRRGGAAEMRIYIAEQTLNSKTSLLDRLRPQLVQAIAMVELLRERWYEPPDPSRVHGSTLVQQLLSSIAQYGGLKADEAWRLLCERGPFDGLTPALFKGLLLELGAKEILMQSSDGTLLLGQKGEAIVGHYSFYAAFSSSEEYRVVNEGRTLGTIPIDNPLEENQLLIFAGRRWLITSIDAKRKVVMVKPSPGGRPPAWRGGGPLVHDRVRTRMREIYLSSEVPPYLDPSARGMLEEGRSAFREVGLGRRNIVQSGTDCSLFPWAGDRAMQTLGLMLDRKGIKAAQSGIALEVAACTPERLYDVLRLLTESDDFSAVDLVSGVKNKHVEKWDGLLSDELLNISYASRTIDVEEALRGLKRLGNETGQNRAHVATEHSPAEDASDPTLTE